MPGSSDGRSSGDYWFRHPLTPEVLEEALPTQRRQSLHAGFAAFLEGRGPNADVSRLAAVADHWSRGGSPDRGASLGIECCRHCGGHGCVAGCRAHARTRLRAARTCRRAAPSTLRRRCRAGREAGLQRDELASVESLIAVMEQDPAARSRGVERTAGPARPPAGVDGAGVLRTRRCETGRRGRRGGARDRCPRFRARRAGALRSVARDPEAPRHAARALDIARAVDDDRALSYALTANAMLAVYAGDDEKGVAFAAAGAEAALRARDWWGLCHAALWEANAAEVWSAAAYAEMLSLRSGLMRSHGAPHPYIAWIAADEAAAWLASGHWERCAKRLREAATSDPGPFVDVQVRLTAARLATWQGRQDEAEHIGARRRTDRHVHYLPCIPRRSDPRGGSTGWRRPARRLPCGSAGDRRRRRASHDVRVAPSARCQGDRRPYGRGQTTRATMSMHCARSWRRSSQLIRTSSAISGDPCRLG